jgi:hypothetical protein
MYPAGTRSPAGSLLNELIFSNEIRNSTSSVISSRNIRADSSPEADRLLGQIGKVGLLREYLESKEIGYARIHEDKGLQEHIG